MTPDCDLKNDTLDDVATHDDAVLNNNCVGESVAVFFYSLSMATAAIGAVISRRFNFPLDGAVVSHEESEEKIDSFADGDTHQHSKAHALPRDTPVASTLFRFKSYIYKGEEEEGDMDSLMNSSTLDKRLLSVDSA